MTNGSGIVFHFPRNFYQNLTRCISFYETIYFIRFASIEYNGLEFYVEFFNQMFIVNWNFEFWVYM